MNFADFQQLREKLLRERGGVLDCAETNLYRALARLAPPPAPAPASTAHRCHLAGEWCERFGFPPETARRALVSCGVRYSLALLFRHCAGKNARLWLPSDNYPVYGELARAAGLAPRDFSTLPAPVWPDAAPADGLELLVVTNPLKPLGRWLAAGDVAALEAWLAASPHRRLLLDTVYTFSTRFDAATRRLVATGQTFLLHSLTKGWLHPRLFGIALVPERDAAALTPIFRAAPPPQENLARAREHLTRHTAMPAAVATALDEARQRMRAAWPAGLTVPLFADAPGYFTVVAAHWSDLLETHNILGIPAAAFGSECEDITILSSLTFASHGQPAGNAAGLERASKKSAPLKIAQHFSAG